MERRNFIKMAAATGALVAGPAAGNPQSSAEASGKKKAGMVGGRRILTLNSVIRVNQIEVSRDRNEGVDEADRHTPENVAALRRSFAAGWPGAPMTWAFSWRALHDQRDNYRQIRKLVARFHEQYGDDVTFIPGAYFANAYNTREQVNLDLHDGLGKASAIIGGGFRPKSVIAGFLSSANLKFLAEEEGIHVCQGNIWSQYAIDNQDGDGSISYPYYPSIGHFCKPAQSRDDFIDCVNLDGWTIDFIAGRRSGYDWEKNVNSRMGVGPIETIGWFGPEVGLAQMIECTAAHFDGGFRLNGWAWVTNCWEVSLVPQIKNLDVLTRWVSRIRERWPEAECLTMGELGMDFRRQYKDNSRFEYRFVQRGTGIGGSDANLEVRWFMNRDFRLALLKDWKAGTPELVIDWTRYDLPAAEPAGTTRNWSLLGAINQKQTRLQDRPVPLGSLPENDREIIFRRYPELKS